MAKIEAYLTKYINDIHPIVDSLDGYVSLCSEFWISTHHSIKTNTCLVLVSGEDADFQEIDKIIHTTTIEYIDIDDIRVDLTKKVSPSTINKIVNSSNNEFLLQDLSGVNTNEDLINAILKKLNPNHCELAFDGIPKTSGTFTDDFTGDDDDLLEDRAGWTLVTDGGYRALIKTNALEPTTGGGGSGASVWTCTDQGSADHYIKIKTLRVEPRALIYLCSRLVDLDNFVGFHVAGSGGAGARLCKNVAGSLTDSIVTFQGVVDAVVKIECNDNTIKIFSNDVQQGSDQTISDHNTETSEGFVFDTTASGNAFFDDFEAGLMAAGGLSIPVAMHHLTKNIGV